MSWFELTGSNPTFSQDYTLRSSAPSCPIGTDQICAVQANNDGSDHPELTEALKDEMILALHTRSSSTNVKLKKP
ncbi:hypothetical protein ORI89_06325 [Sphingobacterium sp. UT-1RO-CII-1]|uniref:hypothetical protein n=1 Tax=Sphingobacterium sp. UT-1RO-CII-1 TaxID=2995225 RepID=UPI00227A7A6C|nr:hypothetical protein [Sphingobacterium sp. UT-1RO-CII-1]MCY4779258.1 hypothetical protein [Sphingobacterium sp. UT-1RO-CII-1]